jgi:phage terminase large subunit-like protein
MAVVAEKSRISEGFVETETVSSAAGQWIVSKKIAERTINFFEKVLVHNVGELSDSPFLLEPWQKKILTDIFGTLDRKTGLRRYRKVYLEIPRKNGKSTLIAGIALTMLVLDAEPGAEIVVAAADTDQARIVFECAKQMVLRSKVLSRRIRCYRRTLVHMVDGLPVGRIDVISADAATKHGKNASCVIIDELHAQPNRDLYDVLLTSMGSRRQPLFISITTAGWDRNSICWEEHEYAERVITGVIDDPTYYGVIYAAGPDDDWKLPETWSKANPNLGVSVKIAFLEQQCRTAMENPAFENTFRRLYLNQWTEQETRWIPMDKWDACAGTRTVAELREMLRGWTCYAGLDLSSRIDLTAFVLVFPPQRGEEKWFVLSFPFIPGDEMRRRINRDRVPYDAWEKQGFLTVLPGERINQDAVIGVVERLRQHYTFKHVAFDRWGADHVVNALERSGFEVVEFGQGMKSMSPPMKEIVAKLLAGEIEHGGDPVLRWAASSVVATTDEAGNAKPVKPDRLQSANRIDPFVATLMALDCAERMEAQPVRGLNIRGF